jgi:hypothetical protein
MSSVSEASPFSADHRLALTTQTFVLSCSERDDHESDRVVDMAESYERSRGNTWRDGLVVGTFCGKVYFVDPTTPSRSPRLVYVKPRGVLTSVAHLIDASSAIRPLTDAHRSVNMVVVGMSNSSHLDAKQAPSLFLLNLADPPQRMAVYSGHSS